MELLKERQVDLTAQHDIAADLLNEVRKKFRFPYQRQCVLHTVRVVATTVSNLQKLESVLTDRDDVLKHELLNLHAAVERHFARLICEVKPWLSDVLPVMIATSENDAVVHMELEVSL